MAPRPKATRTEDSGLVGPAVRAARRHAGLSLRQLAQVADSSAPFLSQVERGHATPSLAMLIRIAEALDTTAAALLTGPPVRAMSIVRAGEGRSYAFDESDDPAMIEVLSPDGHAFTATRYEVRSGQDLGDFLARDGEEMIHMLTGNLLVELTDHGDHRLSSGDTIHYSSAIPHRWRHVGRTRTSFIHVVTT